MGLKRLAKNENSFLQSFEDSSDREETPFRLSMVQAELKNNLSGYLVPRSDVHQGEYVAACDERLSWLTGFTGSAGICIVGNDRAEYSWTAATASKLKNKQNHHFK